MCLFFISSFSSLTFLREVIFLSYEKTYAQIALQVYQKRKSPNSSGGFGFEETKRINQQII